MTVVEYRRTKAFSGEELAALFRSVGWFSAAYPDQLQTAMRNSGHVISAWDGDRLVGLIRGMDDGAWQAVIDCLLVDPAYQGRGIASTLLETLMEEYRDFLYVSVTPEEKKNVSFYEQRGFSVMEEGIPLQRRGRWD